MPNFVERVGLAWFELSASALACFAQLAPLIGAVQPWIEAHLHPSEKIGHEPSIRCRLGDMMALIERGIRLFFDLKRVAAIGK